MLLLTKDTIDQSNTWYAQGGIAAVLQPADSVESHISDTKIGGAGLCDDRAVRITVEDQGPGIPPDKLEKIFQRFYTDRPAGAKFGNNSGLGLSIVRQIVETHRGQVTAENRIVDGKIAGARFVVELPPAPIEI